MRFLAQDKRGLIRPPKGRGEAHRLQPDGVVTFPGRRILWAATVALVAAACAGKFLVRVRPDGVGFTHARHVQAKVECIACHEKLFDAVALGEPGVLPAEAKCLECHSKQKEQGNCAYCHTDPVKPEGFVRQDHHLKLNHAAHIDRVKEDCSVCHAALPEKTQVTAGPTMDSCLGCHEHREQFAQGQCNVCHTDLRRFPLAPVAFFSHQANFVKTHRESARASAETCAQCHDQAFCVACHANTVATPIEVRFPEKVESNFIHRGDFLSRHAIEQRADPALCQRCHASAYCDNCHRAQNLTSSAPNPRSPHPPGFAFPGPNSHATPARHDIASCAACHDQGPASICISCHKVGGIGGDPHPAGWSNRHPNGEIARNSMCQYCHR